MQRVWPLPTVTSWTIPALQVGIRAANDGISKLQIEDGAAGQHHCPARSRLDAGRQAASDTFTGSRATLDEEFQSVLAEITRTATAAGLETGSTNLNSRSVFVGNTQTNTRQRLTYVSFALTTAVDAQGLGISAQNITSATNANTAVTRSRRAVGLWVRLRVESEPR